MRGIRNAVGYILPMVRPSEKCEACGKEFHCDASVWGCWCAEIKLSDAARARLKEKYRGCVCKQCLLHFATGEEGSANEKPDSTR